MSDEIRPVGLNRPRRIRPLSREDREENEERFRKKLAELTGLEQETDASPKDRSEEQQADDTPHDAATAAPAKDALQTGRHLDVET